MSYIVGSTGAGSTPRRRWGRWVALGLAGVVAVIVVVALVGLPSSTGSSATNPGSDTDTDLSWVRVGQQPVPVSAAHGPYRRDGGLAAGFSHDEPGAVLAALNISVRLSGDAPPQVWKDTARGQCTGDVDATLADLATQIGSGGSSDVATEYLYRIGDGDPDGAVVTVGIAAHSAQATQQGGQGAAVGLERTLDWIKGDWRLRLPLSPPYLLGTTDGYRTMGPIRG